MKFLMHRKQSNAGRNKRAIRKHCRMSHTDTTVIGRSRLRQVYKSEPKAMHV